MRSNGKLTVGLAILATLTVVDSALAYYNPRTGRFLSRDPIGEPGFAVVNGVRPLPRDQPTDGYPYVRNEPVSGWDYLGLCAAEEVVKCEGVCGANVDDWIMAEIKAQQDGFDKWKKDHPNLTIEDYLKWANGNQRYKDPDNFKFTQGYEKECGTQPNKDKPGCGRSVTLCGKCVRSAILGNIMYGLIGAHAGFTTKQLTDGATTTKKDWGLTVDEYDDKAYDLGVKLYEELKKSQPPDFCKAFDAVVGDRAALREGRKGGGYNDLGDCRPCPHKTKETRHGGSESSRRMP